MRSSLAQKSPAFAARNRQYRVQLRTRSTKEERRPVCDAGLVDAPIRLWSEGPLEALDGPCHGAAKRGSRTISGGNDKRQNVQRSDEANERAPGTEGKDLRELEKNTDGRAPFATGRIALAFRVG